MDSGRRDDTKKEAMNLPQSHMNIIMNEGDGSEEEGNLNDLLDGIDEVGDEGNELEDQIEYVHMKALQNGGQRVAYNSGN